MGYIKTVSLRQHVMPFRTRKIGFLYACLMTTILAALLIPLQSVAQESAGRERMLAAMEFHLRGQTRTGVLIPLYAYPANVHTNEAFNRVIASKRDHETVPFWVILNPASGPGEQVDANYTKAIDRLQGAGCVILGYVSTSYGKRAGNEVQADIDRWLKLYPKTQGIFFDEMIYEDKADAAEYQAKLNRYAKQKGCWPTVANPGAETPERYFASECADVIVVHESAELPSEDRLKGDYFGGYSDYPPFSRSVLVHSQDKFDAASLQMIRRYVRWIYYTEKPFRANDPKAANPWDGVSQHLESLCEELERD
jgi:Spherulation-specific family 4